MSKQGFPPLEVPDASTRPQGCFLLPSGRICPTFLFSDRVEASLVLAAVALSLTSWTSMAPASSTSRTLRRRALAGCVRSEGSSSRCCSRTPPRFTFREGSLEWHGKCLSQTPCRASCRNLQWAVRQPLS
eukprot:5775836-Pleurochrysis_carterae.AAC.1